MTIRKWKIALAPLALVVFAWVLIGLGQAPNSQPLFEVEQDGKFGYIDRNGKVVIPIQFDSANGFHEGLALVTQNGKKRFIDTAGETLITPQFEIVHNFSEGLAAVNNGQVRNGIGLITTPGKWGYIDKTGKLVIPMKFTHAEDFSESLAAVNVGDHDHGAFIDPFGKIVFEIPLDVTIGFHDGFVGVLLNGSISYYDHHGKKLPISTEYGPKSSSFSEGLLPIQVKDKWGYADKTGKIVIEPRFDDADSFSAGLAPVKMRSEETKWCPRDESGSRAGFTMIWGFIDKTGKFVIAPHFESASPFSEGLAEIHQCDQSFFIDKSGTTVLSGNFRYASSFSDGLAHVSIMKEGKLIETYTDKKGRIIWEPTK